MKRVMTKRQEQAMRRLLIIAGQELASLANSPVMPDNWRDVGATNYCFVALDAIQAQLVKDGVIPPEG